MQRYDKGFVLIALLAMLAIGGLYFFISNLSPEYLRNKAQQQTGDSLAQAREALIGYAIRFRDEQVAQGSAGLVYGYLPMPDLGTSRNNTAGCVEEGCEAANFAGNAANVTVIGRFPWRSLGTGALRDADGECLWYAVSGSHQRVQRASPMNWDTLSQLDVVVANGTAAMASALASAIAQGIASAYDRPIAVIFSPGPPLPGQNRGTVAGDSVTECGGNYDPKNYLDPSDTAALAGVVNFFPATDSASPEKPWADRTAAVTSAASKEVSINGNIHRRGDSSLWSGACPAGSSDICSVASNDGGVTLTSTQLFQTLRGSSYFRTDINAMLERMTECLRDQIAAGGSFTPVALTNTLPPLTDKTVGRIPSNTCYDDTQNPLGYYSHYGDQLFVLKPNAGSLSVSLDAAAAQNCAAGLIFAGQRGTKNPAPTNGGESLLQLRTSAQVSASNSTTNINWPANYLEGSNLTTFTTTGALSLSGNSMLAQVRASKSNSGDIARCTTGSLWKLDDPACHLAEQDIVRCIPSGANLSVVESPNLSAAQQLVAYNPATSTLTLGKENVTNTTADPAALFGCAWTPEEKTVGSGFRSYFQFTFATLGTSVGNTGFVFALIDSESNPNLPCGMAGNHLGYSGDNTVTPKVAFPKIGIEFDQSRNTGFPGTSGESSTNAGRKDPCYVSSCGAVPAQTANSHAAIVYWGHESANATDAVTVPNNDDNVHGFPTAGSLASVRRPPRNPDTSPGIENESSLRTGGQLFHVRIEVTPTRTVSATAENSKTSLVTKVWLLADSLTVANQIVAMKDTTRPMAELYPSFTEKLTDTGTVFDVAGSACSSGVCPANQTCGSDNICYRQGLRKARLGFTGSQRTNDQQVTIAKMFNTWLP